MTEKIYTTAMGQNLDMGALFIKNENVPAVGNMGVTAAGKKLDPTDFKKAELAAQAHRVQAGRITNVKRQTPDATTADAKARLTAEAEARAAAIAARQAAEAAALEAMKSQPEPVFLSQAPVSSSVTKEVIHENDVEMDLMFSAEEAPVDPLTLTLPEPAPGSSVIMPESGLAAAIERANANRGSEL